MYTSPMLFINNLLDGLFAVLFENALAPVLFGLLFAACMVAFLVKIFR